jgi:hypothetical protein
VKRYGQSYRLDRRASGRTRQLESWSCRPSITRFDSTGTPVSATISHDDGRRIVCRRESLFLRRRPQEIALGTLLGLFAHAIFNLTFEVEPACPEECSGRVASELPSIVNAFLTAYHTCGFPRSVLPIDPREQHLSRPRLSRERGRRRSNRLSII